jgi:hypothetical protein
MLVIVMEVRPYLTRGNDMAVWQRRMPFDDSL